MLSVSIHFKKSIFFCLIQLSIYSTTFSQDALSIVRKADEHARGKTSVAQITIQTIRPNWTRELSMKSWSKGNNMAAILITSPAKDKGVVFLKRYKEVWNWIPSIDRNIKMPPSMMSQSWMGTDFTNDDLVKEASIIEDYTHTLLKDTLIDKNPCYQIRLIPKSDAAVLWSRVDMCITKSDYNSIYVTYFDEDGQLVNTLYASEIKNLGGRMLPTRLEMIPADKKGNKTILIYKSLQFDLDLKDTFFATQNMARIK